jgi:HAD superfamily hydrolase (TIGR01509 family)
LIILFDFGNTLAPFNDGEAHAITADLAAFVERRLGLPAHEFARRWLEERDADFGRSAVTGVEHDFGARLARIANDAGKSATREVLAEAERRAVESFVRHVHVDPEVGAAITLLAGRCRLGVLSNYLLSAPIHDVLARDGIHACFEKVVVSQEVGFAKPHPRCFEAILDAMEPRSADTVYVGDDFNADVLGATRAGLSCVWTWAMREPRPEEPATVPLRVRCARSREEYLEFLRAPDEFLGELGL